MANMRSDADLAADRDANLNSGQPEHQGLDDAGRQRLIDALAPRQDNIVGNLADLQRLGASVVEGRGADVEEAVETPPGFDPENSNLPGTEDAQSKQLQQLADDAKAEEKSNG